jgi:hypothetical protein
MKPIKTEIKDVRYTRLGYNYVDFVAIYPQYQRRGTVTYDATEGTFCSHLNDVELLRAVVEALAHYQYRYYKS